MIWFLLLLCITSFRFITDAIKTLEVVVEGDAVHQSVFANVSLGMNNFDHHQCTAFGSKGKNVNSDQKTYEMKFTPNRKSYHGRKESTSHPMMRAAVVLAVGGHSDSKYGYGRDGSINGLLAVWDSWVDYFFCETSGTTSLILLFDERDYQHHQQNTSRSRQQYLDHLLINHMDAKPVDCVRIHETIEMNDMNPCAQKDNHFELEDSYSIYYISFEKPKPPLIIFAAVHHFAKPAWAAAEDEEQLFQTWKTPILGLPYGYVKFTNWYSYYMFQLPILDFFDYVVKLDNDIEFRAPFPYGNIPHILAEKGHYVFGSRPLTEDHPKVIIGVSECIDDFIKQETQYCQQLQSSSSPVTLVEGGRNDPTFYHHYSMIFYSSFLVVWLGLYTAPEVNHLGKFWIDYHPNGMWTHRWTDQQYWPRPLTLFGSGDLKREIGFETLITDNYPNGNLPMVHKPFPKWNVLPSIHYYSNNGNGTTREKRQQITNHALQKVHPPIASLPAYRRYVPLKRPPVPVKSEPPRPAPSRAKTSPSLVEDWIPVVLIVVVVIASLLLICWSHCCMARSRYRAPIRMRI